MRRFFEAAFAPGSQSEYVGKNVHIGSYTVTVDSVLAEGGFAMVYLVNAKLANAKSTKAALKRMFVNDEDTLENCKREINIMKELSGNKNIVRYMAHKVAKLPTGIYEVLVLLEYCSRGHVLDQMNKRLNRGFSEEEVITIFCDVIEAVGCLHSAKTPIAHRDLKVENVLIHDSGRYVLCDFGSASQTQLEPDKIGVSIVEEEISKFTTVQYRAPEMVDLYSGFPISIKADIWALGVLLYHLCFFNLPFSTTLSIQTGEVSVPDNSPFSREIHQLIQFCLNINPELRPDIWQVAEVTFKLAKRQNPLANKNKSFPVEEGVQDYLKTKKFENLLIEIFFLSTRKLSSIEPLPCATELANQKAAQRKLAQERQNGSAAAATSIAPRQRPQPGAQKTTKIQSNEPSEVISKADHALQILQAEMAKIKLQYERLESPQDKKRLEEQAASIKMKYQKILELRNENQAKMTNQSRPQKTEPVKPVEQVISNHAPLPVSTAGGDSQSHRRAVSDPSVIIEYQQNHMSNSRTIASGLSNTKANPIPDEFSSGSFANANPLSVNFGSNSTIDSVKTVRHVGQSKEENEDDQAFDEFLAERKNTQENINFNCEDGPVYMSLESSNNIEAENVSNGGWGQSGRGDDDLSDSSDDSSVELEESPPNHNEISEQQLINSSDEESQPTSKHSRSLTCPDIYSNNQAANPNGPGAIDPNDPFQMAPFPVVVAPSSDDRDPFLSAPFQHRSVSKNNPFRPVKEKSDPFQSAPFHV